MSRAKRYHSTNLIEKLKSGYIFERQKMRSANKIVLGGGKLFFRSEFEFNIAILLDYNEIDWEYENEDVEMLYKRQQKHHKRFLKFGIKKEDMPETLHVYAPDFYLPKLDIYLEPKGHFSVSDRSKMVQIKKYNPEKRIIMILQSPNAKVGQKTATEWCKQKGIEYCTIEDLIKTINK